MYRVMPVVPLFTLACLILVCLEWFRLPLLDALDRPETLYIGCVLIILSGATLLPGGPGFRSGYDLYLLGCLCVWFVHWREIYRVDAPVFLYYPIYFVLLVTALTQMLVYRFEYLDKVQYKLIDLISGLAVFYPALLFLLVLLSVYFRDQFIYFPIVVSFVIIRCSFSVVLEEVGGSGRP